MIVRSRKLRSFAWVLALAALIGSLASCGAVPGAAVPAASGEEAAGMEDAGSANPWAELTDFSEHRTVRMLVVGDRPSDMDEVLEHINRRLNALINTDLELSFITLSDWSVVYPLMLTGADQLDLIYTSYWCNYQREAARGAFLELDNTFLTEYMPESLAGMPPEVWDYARVSGRLFAVPRSYTDNASYGAALIRKDALDAAGMESVTSYDGYEEFLLKSSSFGLGGYGLYAFPSLPMTAQLMMPREHLLYVTDDMSSTLVWDSDEGEITPENVEYLYMTDEYARYCRRMAEYAKAGVWPSNAISGMKHVQWQFEDGRSYSMIARIQEAQQYIDAVEAKGHEVVYTCLLDEDAFTMPSDYSGDMMAVSRFPADPVRAAICLDALRCDRELNFLCQGGIEGRHYILNGDGTRGPGPEAADYPWSCWAWALRNRDFYPGEQLSAEVEQVSREIARRQLPAEKWPFGGFTLDNSKYAAEIALMGSIVEEYRYSFDLGVFGDETEAKLEQFREELKDAGMDVVLDDWKRQVEERLKAAR